MIIAVLDSSTGNEFTTVDLQRQTSIVRIVINNLIIIILFESEGYKVSSLVRGRMQMSCM